jgi:hypothetical protein
VIELKRACRGCDCQEGRVGRRKGDSGWGLRESGENDVLLLISLQRMKRATMAHSKGIEVVDCNPTKEV